MTVRVNGTPDRFVNEIDTFGGGGGGAGGSVDQGNAGIQKWIVTDTDTQASLATILTELGNILAELQGTLNILGSVAVSNFPASQAVTFAEPVSVDDNGGSLTVDGSVAVSNFPATQPVSGTVEVTNDVGNPLPVSATDLDIRNLTAATDTVTAAINGLPTIEFAQFAVTGVEVAIPTVNLASRKTISIKALAANGAEVYIGETGVTSSTGYELSAGDSIELDVDATVALFAVSSSGSQRVSICEVA